MLKNVSILAVALALSAAPSMGAVRFDFRQTTRSDFQTMPPTDVQGTVVLEGDRSRLDFKSGSIYGKDSYIIASDGGQRLSIVNPTEKTYAVVDVAATSRALGESEITVKNLKTDVSKLEDHPIVAGLPTDHYRILATYDITVVFGTLPLTQKVETVIDKWVTTAFGDVQSGFLVSGPLKTGNENLDRLMDAETRKVGGLVLRQLITISTTSDLLKPKDSQLKLSPTRRQTSEMLVTSVQALPSVSGNFFQVPGGFRKVDNPISGPEQNPVQDLSLEPTGQ